MYSLRPNRKWIHFVTLWQSTCFTSLECTQRRNTWSTLGRFARGCFQWYNGYPVPGPIGAVQRRLLAQHSLARCAPEFCDATAKCVDVVCLQIHSRVKKLRAKKVPSEVIVLDAQPSLPVEVSGNVDVYLTKRPDVKRGSWLEVVEQITGDLWMPIKTC